MLNDREKADGTHTHAMGMDAIIITSCYAYGLIIMRAGNRTRRPQAALLCTALSP